MLKHSKSRSSVCRYDCSLADIKDLDSLGTQENEGDEERPLSRSNDLELNDFDRCIGSTTDKELAFSSTDSADSADSTDDVEKELLANNLRPGMPAVEEQLLLLLGVL